MGESQHIRPLSRQRLAEIPRFAVPEPPAWFVRRPRLVTSLDDAARRPVVLVSAPAGSGKTSLVADWLRHCGTERAVGWVTFEEGDEHVWDHVLRCLEMLGVQVPAAGYLPADTEGHTPLSALVAAVNAHTHHLTLVLDGFEFATAGTGRSLHYLLQHTTDHLSAIIVTRVDPVLPLYRYRLEDKLGELRAADLAFTDDEASLLLERSGVQLGAAGIHSLNSKLRGWAAGLRFAARSLVVRDDPDRAVADVVAESGDIGEYLLTEVLEAQKPDVREILLRVSVPETLYPGLAEELAGQPALRTVSTLTKINAFLEPVDEQAGCYRYYPFFRDLLRTQLAYESPQLMRELQRKTASWLERHGLLEAAVAQLASAGAWSEAAALVVESLAIAQVLGEDASGPFRRALSVAPADSTESTLLRAAFAAADGDGTKCDAELGRLPPGRLASEAAELSRAVICAVRRRHDEDPAEVLRLADEALEEMARYDRSRVADHPELGALVLMSRGLALFRLGDLGTAASTFSAAADAASASHVRPVEAACLARMAVCDAVTGRLGRAARAATRAVALTDALGQPGGNDWASSQVALGWVALQQLNLNVARVHAQAAGHADLEGQPLARGLLSVVQASLLRARGRPLEALELLKAELDRLSPADVWLILRLRAEAARTRLQLGDVARALAELDALAQTTRSGAPLDPDMALVRARAHRERDDLPDAEPSRAVAHIGGGTLEARVASLVMEAAAQQGRDAGRARAALDRSLRLAAPEELRRPFHEAGPEVHRMLRADTRLAAEHTWLTSSLPLRPPSAQHRRGSTPAATTDVAAPAVLEPLTPKELEVLGHLAELLSTDEIAATMFVSKNTVRTHIRSILRKLGVTRRNIAVRRARELSLLPS